MHAYILHICARPCMFNRIRSSGQQFWRDRCTEAEEFCARLQSSRDKDGLKKFQHLVKNCSTVLP